MTLLLAYANNSVNKKIFKKEEGSQKRAKGIDKTAEVAIGKGNRF
jgi:hypothetical protein